MNDGRAIGGPGTPEEWLEHAGWVRALARALVRDAATADDVVQETWLAALRRAPRTSGPLRPWLARIVRNVATDRARAETRRIDRESAQASRDPEHARAPDEIAESIETQKLLLASVEKLADPLRSAVVRRYFHGMTSIEIAREDGVGESTVRERIERGLQALRRDLDARHRGDRGAWMAALVPIARRADVHAASVAGSTAIVTTGLAMATMWKIAVAALVVVAAFVGTRAWMNAPVAVTPLQAMTKSTTLDEVRSSPETDATTSSARSSAATKKEVLSKPSATTSAQVDRIAYVEARIVDKSGVPISNAVMTCVDRLDFHEVERKDAPFANSDTDGRVRLELHGSDSPHSGGVMDWADTIWSANVEVTAPRFAPHRAGIQLDEGHTSSCGTIVLVDGGCIEGRVVDEHGNALHGEGLNEVTVHVVRPDLSLDERDRYPWSGLDGREIAKAKTSLDGTFRLEGIPVGVWCVWTQRAGRECALDDHVWVKAGETTRLDDLSTRADAGAIHGTLVEDDGSPAQAEILYASIEHTPDLRWSRTKSAADGRFIIDVAPGSIVDVYCDNSNLRVPTSALSRNVTAGTYDLVMRLQPLPRIDVLVQDENGAAIAGWGMDISEPLGNGETRQNVSAGHRSIPVRGVPFTLEFRADGFEPRKFGPFDESTTPPALVVTLRHTKIPQITGRVMGAGRPIAHARIRVCKVLTDTMHIANGFPMRLPLEGAGGGDTRPDGTFVISLPDETETTIVVQPWANDGENAVDGFARTEIRNVEWSAFRDHELDIELRRGGRLEGRVIAFSPSTTMLFVSASCGDYMVRSTRIQADGSYAFDHMAAGEWLVRPTSRDYTDNDRFATAPPEPANMPITINDGATTRLDLAIPKSEGVTIDGVLQWSDASVWTAKITRPDTGNYSEDEQSVAADGTFHLHVEDAGRHHLALRMVSSKHCSAAIDCDLDLLPGTNTWRFAPELSALSETNAPVRNLALECRAQDGIVWTAQWRTDGAGRNDLDSVPIGDVRITDKGRVLSTVRVLPHEVATVVWN